MNLPIQRSSLTFLVAGLVCVNACSTDRAASPDPTPAATDQAASRPATIDPPNSASCINWSDAVEQVQTELPESPHRDLLNTVWTRVAQKHVDPTLGCIDWRAIGQTYGHQLIDIQDRAKAVGVINDMLGELEQSHFRLFPPFGDDRSPKPNKIPIDVRWVEQQVVVVHSEAAAIPTGAVVLAVDDHDLTEWQARAAAVGPPSTSTYAHQLATTVSTQLTCDAVGEPHELRIDVDDDVKSVIGRCVAPKGERVTLGHLANMPTLIEHRVFEGQRIGYLKFNIWMVPMVARIRAALTDLQRQGIRALVIDLRGNPGGVGPMAVPVARMLLDQPASLGTLHFREFDQTFQIEPDPQNPAFLGPTVLLVDEGTASTSEIFAAGLRDLQRVTIIGGRPSAGAALPSVIEQLQGGALLQYAVGTYTSPQGLHVEGTGLEPDIKVVERRQDFRAGRDPVIDAALQHLHSQIDP